MTGMMPGMPAGLPGVLTAMWNLLAEMAPYLLLGFFVAGVLHVTVRRENIYRYLSTPSFTSVLRATLLGVPLPLCSCGVIPVAAHLKKEGATSGATVAFLASTPTTGVDSILATYSLLGLSFAVVRVLSSFFAGVLSGSMTLLTDRPQRSVAPAREFSCAMCDSMKAHSHPWPERVPVLLVYAFRDLLQDTGRWILIGVVIGGLIGWLFPEGRFWERPAGTLLSYAAMLAVGIPLYVCATGSIPIAAGLVSRGMSPGAGMVFLIAGPATNASTISFVAGKLGRRAAVAYLVSIAVTAVVFGALMDIIWIHAGRNIHAFMAHRQVLPHLVKNSSAVLLLLLLAAGRFPLKRRETPSGQETSFRVPGMTCRHCVSAVGTAVGKVQGVRDVRVDLKRKRVSVSGDASLQIVREALEKAGYPAEE